MRKVNQIVMDILQSKEDLADLCEYLDSCYDLYELGYINSKVEQDILITMAEECSALTLWALHKYANENDINYEYTFNEFVKGLKIDEQGMREREVRALVFFRQFDKWEDLQDYLNLAEDPMIDSFEDMPDSLISACYFYATGFDESFKSIFDDYIERVELS